jgi:exodeoxyribonuclease V
MELAKDQEIVYDWVMDNIKNKTKLFTTGGYAGTGKTFLISKVTKDLEKENKNIKIAFVAFTGKASSVLKRRLREIQIDDEYRYFVGTIHSLIYRPRYVFSKTTKKMIVVEWIKVSDLPEKYDLIVIDEASMISKELLDDLLTFDIPIWAVGDHGQLPPISELSFSLMKNPDSKLETIHRQASNNPIIKLSEMARKQGSIPFGVFSSGVCKLPRRNKQTMDLFNNVNFSNDVVVICALNKTRIHLNDKIRMNLKFLRPEPYPGERIICLKNNYKSGIMNGEIGTMLLIKYEAPDVLEICAQMDNENDLYNGLCYLPIFGKETYTEIFENIKERFKEFKKITRNTEFSTIDYFDFGYAISCHKALGSQWKKVIVFEERSYYWDDEMYARWLYTALTRSEEKLMVISYD